MLSGANLLENIQHENARAVRGAIKGEKAGGLMNELAWESLKIIFAFFT